MTIDQHAYFNRIRSRIANKEYTLKYEKDDWVADVTVKFPISFCKGFKITRRGIFGGGNTSAGKLGDARISTGLFGHTYYLKLDDIPADIVESLSAITLEEIARHNTIDKDHRAAVINAALSSLAEFDYA